MSLVNGRCPVCGAEIKVPDESERSYCLKCGQQILTNAAITYAAAQQPQGIMPENSTLSIQNDTTPSQQTVPSPTTVLDLDLIGSPSWGWYAIGAVFSVGFYYMPIADLVTEIVVSLAFAAASLLYAAWIYPSLFSSDPFVKSASVSSFLNGLLGGPIFGALWTRCLKRRKIGSSHIVLIVLFVTFILIFIAIGMYRG